MKVYDSLQQFWDEFSAAGQNNHGFDDWTIVRFRHTSDRMYAQQVVEGKDELGFQPLSIITANPFTHESEHVLVKDIRDQQFQGFKELYADYFMKQLDKRFGSFQPEKFDAYTEYDTWENFKNSWIERDGKPVIMHNFPLLFDHMPKLEYWSRKQTNQKVLPYQRLIVTTYFVSRNEFFDFIIKDVSDEEAAHIQMLLQSRIGLNLETLFTP